SGIIASAELYDPASGSWTSTGSLNTGRGRHTATLLSNEMVLVAGGVDFDGFLLASAELYDTASGSWSATGTLTVARDRHTATLLSNGMVLVAAGDGSNNVLSSAELYEGKPSPSPTPTGTPSGTPRPTSTPRPRPSPAPRPTLSCSRKLPRSFAHLRQMSIGSNPFNRITRVKFFPLRIISVARREGESNIDSPAPLP